MLFTLGSHTTASIWVLYPILDRISWLIRSEGPSKCRRNFTELVGMSCISWTILEDGLSR